MNAAPEPLRAVTKDHLEARLAKAVDDLRRKNNNVGKKVRPLGELEPLGSSADAARPVGSAVS